LEIKTTEYTSIDIPRIEEEICQETEKYLQIYPLDEKTYKLCMQGYVGALKLTKTCTLYSYPKVGISNVLRMFDYSTRKFQTTDHILKFDEEANFLDLLARIFIQEVETICRTAYRRFYSPRIENLLTIKGKILVSETILQNRFLPYVTCEYQDFTDDIIENRILKYATYLQLKAFAGNKDKKQLYHKLRNLYSFFDNVTLEMIPPKEIDKMTYDRLNRKYEKAHYISRFFLEYLYISHGFGESSFYSFMIDMEKLFEDFVRNVIQRYNQKYTTTAGSNYLDITRSYVKLKPDIIMKQNGKIKLVLDCKYKKVRKIPEDYGVDLAKPYPSDVYQMLSYMVAYECPKGVLVYPKGECDDLDIQIMVESKQYIIHVKQIDLMRLDEDVLRDFSSSMDNYVIK